MLAETVKDFSDYRKKSNYKIIDGKIGYID